jgi:hypothetical protein
MNITRDIAKYSEQDQPMHRWSLVINGETVSELWVDIDTGEIMQVETPRAHRENGYATALYRRAASEATIYHAPESHRTADGNRFAYSVGGDSLPCLHGCCTDEPDFNF